MSGSYFMYGSILEKCRNFRKNGRFSGRIWPDWGNTTRADMAGLGVYRVNYPCPMSSLRGSHAPCRSSEMPYVVSLVYLAMSISSMSHVYFKKMPNRHVEYRGQEP